MAQIDITQTNKAVREQIEVTENPRHRYLLQAYGRHRNLEHAGRVEEIFAPEMMVERPVYRFNMIGQPPMQLDGREHVEPLYRLWAATSQSIFYTESETGAAKPRFDLSVTVYVAVVAFGIAMHSSPVVSVQRSQL